jgi:hypothetical protein
MPQLINQTTTSPSEKFWAFESLTGTTGTFYYGGYYSFAATDNDFSTPPNWGTANLSYAAHFFVVLGAETVDELTIRVTGTSITDAGVRTTSDTQDIVIPSGTAVDSYFETPKKWLGTVVVSVQSGTAKTCNYGWCKYWDNNNNDFMIEGLEATWLGGATENSPDILLRHHKATGWTFNSGAPPTPPAAVASMATDHDTEIKVALGEEGAWKRSNLNEKIFGGDSEGTIVEVVTTANRAFASGVFVMRIIPI